jgi:hypothetical protein
MGRALAKPIICRCEFDGFRFPLLIPRVKPRREIQMKKLILLWAIRIYVTGYWIYVLAAATWSWFQIPSFSMWLFYTAIQFIYAFFGPSWCRLVYSE